MKKSIQRPAGLTDEMVKAAEAVFVAMAYVQAIRPTVEAYQEEITLAAKLPVKEKYIDHPRMGVEGNIIKSYKDVCYADLENIDWFWQRLHERHISEGFNVKEVGHCPLLIAEHEEIKARWELEKAFEPIHKLSFVPYEKTKQLQELCLKLAAPFVRSSEELMKELVTA